MTPFARLAGLRGRALDAALGVNPAETLNAADPRQDAAGAPAALSKALGRSLAAMKRAAADAQGARVDYARLAESGAYRIYRDCVSSVLPAVDPAGLRTREERLAFWINLYNALILDAVVAYDVKTSVADARLNGLAFFRRAAYDVGGLRFSCEDIEHGVLRANRGNPFIPGAQWDAGDPRLAAMVDPPDPRVHFALNCASRSCPPIAVYDPEHVETQLELAARNFIGQEVTADPARGELRLSSLFHWYERDFGGRAPMQAFIAERLPDPADRAWLAGNAAARLVYQPYDWGLNRLT
jgi:hypothetical protein